MRREADPPQLPVARRHRDAHGRRARPAPRLPGAVPDRRAHVVPAALGEQPVPHAARRRRARGHRVRLPLPADPSQQHDPVPLPPRLHRGPERAARPEHPAHRVQGRHPHLRQREGVVLAGRESRRASPRRSGSWPRAGSSTTRSSGGRTSGTSRSSTTSRGASSSCRSGEAGHHHPSLRGVVDLRGQTTTRQLVRLVYHAQGAISAVSFLMHLAAAVEVKPGDAEEPPLRRGRRRARAAAVDRVSAPPVHPHRGRAALLRRRRVLEVAHAAARRRRRKGQRRTSCASTRSATCPAAWT